MRRGELSGLVILVIVGAFLLTYRGCGGQREQPEPEGQAENLIHHIPMEEVEKIVANKYASQRNVGKISAALDCKIQVDPEYVIFCLALQEAKHWPGLSDDDERLVRSLAGRSSTEALKTLRVCVYHGVVSEMKRGGYDPDKERLVAWYDNNPATSLLYLDLPLAKAVGKEREFIKRKLEGYREGAKQWYEPEVSFEQYCAWRCSGEWPFPGEKQKIYPEE